MLESIRVASVQTVSGVDVVRNVERVGQLVAQAADEGANWVVLPEYWPIMGQQETDKLAHAEDFGVGRLQDAMADWAARYDVVLFGGSVPLRSAKNSHVFNSLLVYGRDGACIGRYDKTHLFGFTGLGERYSEADSIEAGDAIPRALEVDGWRVAVGICYDLRFPEFFRAQLPFDALILPAAFTHTTGQAHWQMLLQARAVENQCFVAAAGQGGLHENGRRTFGHSMLIEPWGEIVACLPEGEGVVCADWQRGRLQSVRSKLPALQNRRF